MPTTPKTKNKKSVGKSFAKHPPKVSTAKKPKAVKSTQLELVEPVKYEGDSKRPVKDILSDRVKYLGEVGIELMPDTEIGEIGPIHDSLDAHRRHASFLLGDLINQAIKLFGEPAITAMMAQTGRAMSTLRGYVTTAKAFPAKQRVEELDFSSHQVLTRLEPEQRKEIITLALEDKAKPLNVREIKKLAKVKFPKKTKVKAPVTTKLSNKPKVDYVMLPSEKASFDHITTLMGQLSILLEGKVDSGGGESWVRFLKKLTKKEREEVAELLKPAAKLWMQIK